MTRTRPGRGLMLGVAVLLCLCFLVISQSRAYESYHDPNLNDQGYCSECHPGFTGGRSDTTHALHTGGNRITGNCDLCHTGSGRDNPLTLWSTGDGSANSSFGCAGCHGRDYGEFTSQDYRGLPSGGAAKLSGYGLRRQHLDKGVTRCLDCHSDVQRCFIQPESVLPLYYTRTDVEVADTCFDALDSLDNDGDGRVNTADPDCGFTPVTPGEAGDTCDNVGILDVTGIDASGNISVVYGMPCGSNDSSIYYGPLTQADISSYNYTGQICSISPDGSLTFNPGAGGFFFVVTADDGTNEGSYGEALTGVDPNNPTRRFYVERPPDPGGACVAPQDLANRCD